MFFLEKGRVVFPMLFPQLGFPISLGHLSSRSPASAQLMWASTQSFLAKPS